MASAFRKKGDYANVPPADKQSNFGQIVVHPGFSPKTALAYIAYGIHFKTPSEHTINYDHYPLELQVEHHLDLIKSLIWPDNAKHSQIPRKAFVSFLAKVGGNNPFFRNILSKEHPQLLREERMGFKVLDREKVPFATGKDLSWELKPNDFNLFDLFNPQKQGVNYQFIYAMYEGSTTTPPCQEDAYWIVITNTINVGRKQLIFIDSMFSTKPSRTLQKQNERWITWGNYDTTDIFDVMGYNAIKNKTNFPMTMPDFSYNKRQRH